MRTPNSFLLSITLHAALFGALGAIVVGVQPAEERPAAIVVRRPHPTPPAPRRLPERSEPARPRTNLLVEHAPRVDLAAPEEPLPVPPSASLAFEAPREELHLDPVIGLAAAARSGAAGRRRLAQAREHGGDTRTIRSVEAGLRWLARHQREDGTWGAQSWQDQCRQEPGCGGAERDRGYAKWDLGVTALAVLALQGHGHSTREGAFSGNVKRGLRALVRAQDEHGRIGWPSRYDTSYNHSLATFALCEAVRRGDRGFLEPAKRAVRVALAAQNAGLGWRYDPQCRDNDTSNTGWFVLALRSARAAGIEVPERAFEDAVAWVDRVTTSYGETSYQTPGGGSSRFAANHGKFDDVPTNTAVALVVRLPTRPTRERAGWEPWRRGLQILAAAPPEWTPRKLNFYYWYYGTYALFHWRDPAWEAWNAAMLEALLPQQNTGGCADGSWDGLGEWCIGGGRVYGTAINLLTLEVYYRQTRLLEAGEGAEARRR